MNTRLVVSAIAATAACAWAPCVHAEALHADVAGTGWMLEETQPLSSGVAMRAEPLSFSRDAITQGAAQADGPHTAGGGVFMNWSTVTGMRLSGLRISPLRVRLQEAAGQRSVAFADFGDVLTIARFDIVSRAPALHDEQRGDAQSLALLDPTGRASLTDARVGPRLAGLSQAALDRQLAQLRESVAHVRVMPQATLGSTLKF